MNNKIVYIGCFVSFQDSRGHVGYSQAGNLYQEKLIKFVSASLVLSILPIFARKGHEFTYHSPVCFINNQSSLPAYLNRIYKVIFDTIEAAIKVYKAEAGNVVLYNLDKQNFILAFLLKYLLRKQVYVIAADYVHGSSISAKLIAWLYRKLDGAIILNSNIECNDNTRLLPGLLYRKDIINLGRKPLSRNVMLSGSLGVTTGLELALDFFSKNPEYNLYITGRAFRYGEGEFEKLMSFYQSNFSNIKYMGLLDYEGYIKLLNDCDVALSLRKPEDEEHKYNFPSKILEYLSNSKFVISSLEYQDVPNGILFQSEFDLNSLGSALEVIYSMDDLSIERHRLRTYEYLQDHFTEDKFRSILSDLMGH